MKPYLSILAIVFVVVFGSCNDNTAPIKDENVSYNNYRIVKLDGCEYVLYTGYYGAAAIVHSGSCHNPIHHLYPAYPGDTIRIIGSDYQISSTKEHEIKIE